MDSSQVRLEVAILAAEEATTSQPPAAGRPRTILIIGTDEDTRGKIRDSLRDRGDVRIVVAPTVAKLLALAKVDEDIARLLG